ncbi:Uncharacterised protein [Leminorella richardii]|uniref:Uncharacterized protein n=1 Tax=Leminorella richardii TaxID=158841 RepID=A0A2X4V0B0_9GAMM|nr:hypothetical protein [Leminorella richardii]SQI41568.1 Uncharacterised protein [Leminorella richardii]
MFPINTIYIIFGSVAAVVAIALFIVFRKSNMLKKGAPALALAALAGVYMFCVNHVYIVTDDNSVDEYGLIMSSDFTLVNGSSIRLVPEKKIDKSWLVNNGSRRLVFETVIYGNTSKNPYDFELDGYKAIGLDNAIDYLFVTPPNSIKTKSKSATKGWLHR